MRPTEVTATIINVANASCNGFCDGSATANPSGGTGTFTFAWDAAAGSQTTATATGLCAGTYNVTITDGNGCSIVESVTITEPTPIVVTSSSTSASCNGFCDGTATIETVSGWYRSIQRCVEYDSTTNYFNRS